MKIVGTLKNLEAMRQAIKDLETKKVEVGFFETSKYDDAAGTPVAYVAAIQEFGYPEGGIPARPFMRPTQVANSSKWTQQLAAGSKMVVAGKLTVPQMLGQFGEQVVGQVKETIASVETPPLSESTIAARKRARKSPGVSTKPLVDTALMLGSVQSKVSDV